MRASASANSGGVMGPKDRPRRGSNAKPAPSATVKASDRAAAHSRNSPQGQQAVAARASHAGVSSRGGTRPTRSVRTSATCRGWVRYPSGWYERGRTSSSCLRVDIVDRQGGRTHVLSALGSLVQPDHRSGGSGCQGCGSGTCLEPKNQQISPWNAPSSAVPGPLGPRIRFCRTALGLVRS